MILSNTLELSVFLTFGLSCASWRQLETVVSLIFFIELLLSQLLFLFLLQHL
jgi:hypothetical protein